MRHTSLTAVLTGDLIRSRKATPQAVAAAMQVLQQAADDFGKIHDETPRFTRFRGDGWQIHLSAPNLAYDATLYLVARLRAAATKIDTRISIGIGTTRTIGTHDLSDASGTAFFASGDHLETMSPRRQFSYAGAHVWPYQIALFDLAEFMTKGWTSAQAEAAALDILGPKRTHDDIAAQLGITRQAVQSRLAGAGLRYLDHARHVMRHHDYAKQPDPQ